ncbi:MAG TPA: hypothetical protein VNG33_24300 [Polyangiaceae bacterium]|nr:hypothetical protein [Polyangiaceae bacterium]
MVALSSVPSLALADESLAQWAERRVTDGLVKPLANLEGSRFSRSRPMPHERRVRVLQTEATLDGLKRPFVRFAIDIRYGTEWKENDIVGCAYRESGAMFVKYGDRYRPAAYLLGKKLDPVSGVCEAPSPSARS